MDSSGLFRLSNYRLLFLGCAGLLIGGLSSLGLFSFLPYLSEALRHVRPNIISSLVNATIVTSLFLAGLALALLILKSKFRWSARVTTFVITLAWTFAGLSGGASLALDMELYLQIPREARSEFYNLHATQNLPIDSSTSRYVLESVGQVKYFVEEFQIEGSYHRLEVGDKASGWLAPISETEFLLVQGDGLIIFGTVQTDANRHSLRLESVTNNLQIELGPDLRAHGKSGVRGVVVIENFVVIAATDKFVSDEGKDCYVTSLWSAKLSAKTLEFHKLFRPNYCPSGHELEILESGGALMAIPPEFTSASLPYPTVLFASGDYRDRPAAQELTAQVGSILEVSLVNGLAETRAKGVRNPQGFAYMGNGEVWFTEQGPEGGDEVNHLILGALSDLPNFGWPISSYGSHYGNKLQPGAPLLKSHIDFGFVEPGYFWVPSIAPAGISPNPLTENPADLVVASLGETPKEGDMSLLFLEPSNYAEFRLYLSDYLYMGERMRDVIALGPLIICLGDDGAVRVVTPYEE